MNIIGRHEIEPLLARAEQVLAYYDTAMNCSAAVLDRNGAAIKTPVFKEQMKFCELCRQCFQNPSMVKNWNWMGRDYPCEKVHFQAQTESRRISGIYIYTCPLGFIYWTSPLYRNGRYAGACTAGQILSCEKAPFPALCPDPALPAAWGHKAAMQKFRSLCKDESSAEKFYTMLKTVPEKYGDEIQAMARLLGICTEEISEKPENTNRMIRTMAFRAKEHEKTARQVQIPAENTAKKKASPGNHTEGGPLHGTGNLMEKERTLLAAFRRGDNKTGNMILDELLTGLSKEAPHNFEIIRFRALELAVLLSRAAVNGGPEGSSLPDANSRYLRRIQESQTTGELIENLQRMAELMAGKIFSFQGIQHASVLRKAERYIWENYSRKISLEEIAGISGLSAPYFSTIFREEMGENFSSYLNRLRVERAAALLTETVKPMNEIASLCGFEDQSWFSKIFKMYAGISPGKFRKAGFPVSGFVQGKSHSRFGRGFPGTAAFQEYLPAAR